MSSTTVIATAVATNAAHEHSALHAEEQPAKASKQRRKTLSRSFSHLRQSSRIEQHNDSDDGRPSWLDAYVCLPPLPS
jgi:hypothetical protein